MAKRRVYVLSADDFRRSPEAAAFESSPAPMPVVEDIYSISDRRAWVVVCTDFAQEKKAEEELRLASIETFVPIERDYVRKVQLRSKMVAGMIRRTREKTIRRPVERPLLPGYIFAQVPVLKDRLRVDLAAAARIVAAKGVASILGTDAGPLPIPDDFISTLIHQQRSGAFDKTSNRNCWAKKDVDVRIADGPFASFLGTIEECMPKEIFRVVVEIFGRKTPVLVELAQIEKV